MKRRLAKLMFRLSGLLSRVKTYRTFYRVVRWDPIETVPVRHWGPCRASTRLLKTAMRLDWDHFDHWACVHSPACSEFPCEVCGGLRCEDAEATL